MALVEANLDELVGIPTDVVEVETVRFERVRNMATVCGQTLGRLGLLGVRAGLVAGCGIASLGAFGETTADIGPATVAAHMTVDLNGEAVFRAGPGEVHFDVSNGPLGMKGQLLQIDSDAPQQIQDQLSDGIVVSQSASSNNPNDILSSYEDPLEDLANDARRKGALLLLAGGIFGGLAAEAGIGLARSVRNKEIPTATKLGVMGVTALLLPNAMLTVAGGWTAATWREDALEHPTFGNDSLGELVTFAQSSLSSFERYQRNSAQLTDWLNNLILMQQNAADLPGPNQIEGLIPVLAISDIHSRPCSYERAQDIINAFDVAFVLNTGDEYEWSQPFEDDLFACNSSIENMGDLTTPDQQTPMPVVYTPGNHDGRAAVSRIEGYGNVLIPREETLELTVETENGPVTFRIAGGPDPLFTPDVADRPSPEEERASITEFGERIDAIVERDNPDFVALHTPEAMAQIDETDEEPVFKIQGHAHEFSFDRDRNTLTLGSFGGAGLRTLEYGTSVQGTVIYFDPETRQPVWGWDLRVGNDGESTAEPVYFQDPTVESIEVANN